MRPDTRCLPDQHRKHNRSSAVEKLGAGLKISKIRQFKALLLLINATAFEGASWSSLPVFNHHSATLVYRKLTSHTLFD